MPDREKVIDRLQKVSRYFKSMMIVGYDGDLDIYREHRESVKMAIAMLKEQEAVFANLVVDWLREIALNNFDCNRDMTFLDAVEDIRDRASYGLKQYFMDKLEGR